MKIVECPRDAMQGIHTFIPTAKKSAYLNQLLKVGFDTLDFGSFVSPKAVPQMKDTKEVLEQLEVQDSKTKLLAIIANLRGAKEAAAYPAIFFLGYPLSISETFQKRNTNKTLTEAIAEVEDIQNICTKESKKLVVYLSMGFGNPYGDPYNAEVVLAFAERLNAIGVEIISLSDTIGIASSEDITYLIEALIPEFPEIEIGAHLHSNPSTALQKIAAAYTAGCRRFDGALNGYGGCPMAKDELVGNLATEEIIGYLKSQKTALTINEAELNKSLQLLKKTFPQ